MKRTKEEAAQTRQALLDAALAEFSRKGYQATRLQDIAAAAGATRGAIYHHFGNKAHLYRTLLDEASALGSQAIEKAIAAGGEMTDILRAILVNSIRLATKDRRFRQVLALSLYRTGVDPELADLMEQRILESQQLVQGIAGFMSMGIDSGQLRSDASPENLARAFLAYQNGLFLLWLSSGEGFSIGQEANGRRAERLVDVFMEELLA